MKVKGLVLDMPESFDDRVKLLNDILQNTLEDLLREARSRNVLDAPYGRPPTPTPFVDVNDIDSYTDLEDDQDDENLEFKYEYGFNPLIYLGKLIMKYHPSTLSAIRNNILKSSQRLQFRVAHARRQLQTAVELREILEDVKCGILHGPITTPINNNTVICFCRAVAAGEVVCQISKYPDFSEIVGIHKGTVSSTNFTARVVIKDLEVDTHYYLRCSLQDEGYDLPPSNLQDGNADGGLGNTISGRARLNSTPSVYSIQSRAGRSQLGGVLKQPSVSGKNSTLNPRRSSNALVGGNNSGAAATPRAQAVVPPPTAETLASWHPNAKFRGVDQGSFKSCEFWTMPADSDNTASLTIIASHKPFIGTFGKDPVPSSPSSSTTSAFMNVPKQYITFDTDATSVSASNSTIKGRKESPIVTCVLGPVMEGGKPGPHATVTPSTALWRAFHQSSNLRDPTSVLRLSSILVAWQDLSTGADTGLKAEEVIFSQYMHDLRRHERRAKRVAKKDGGKSTPTVALAAVSKPPPKLVRPPLSPAVEAVVSVRPTCLPLHSLTTYICMR